MLHTRTGERLKARQTGNILPITENESPLINEASRRHRKHQYLFSSTCTCLIKAKMKPYPCFYYVSIKRYPAAKLDCKICISFSSCIMFIKLITFHTIYCIHCIDCELSLGALYFFTNPIIL